MVAAGRSHVSGQADILVAGAGPAGLALALQAHDHGAVVRVVEWRPEAFRPSRALILHSRTLEVLHPLGVTQALLARADVASAADLRLGSRVVRVTLADLALPDTAFPHLSPIRQMDVERVLAQALADRGVEASAGGIPSALRGRLAPLAAPLVPALTGGGRLVAEAIRLVSQLRVSYRGSPLSVEGTPRRRGGPRAGDRLPDQLVSSAGRSIRLHYLVARPGVHVLLDRDADLIGTLHPGRSVNIHRLSSSPGHGLVAVRPDGYIGFRSRTADVSQLAAWLARLGAGGVQG